MSNGDAVQLPQINVTVPSTTGPVTGPPQAEQDAGITPGAPLVTNPATLPPDPDPFVGWTYKRFTREPYPMRAVLVVDGMEYFEWESVSVRMAYGEWPPYTFRFTCSEQTPWPAEWAFLRIRPGDSCSVYLDGLPAIQNGIVTIRQVAFNATTHAVEIQGMVAAGILSKVAAQLPGGEAKNVPLGALASQVAGASAGIGVAMMGNPFSGVIDRVTRHPGESAYDLIERYARATGTFMTSNPAGQLVLMGEVGLGGGDNLIEGINILEGREVIQAAVPNEEATSGQASGGDSQWGAAQNQMISKIGAMSGSFMNGLKSNSLNETVVGNLQQLMQRARIEANVNDELKISVTIVHLGFQRPSGGLWQPGQIAYVHSPMLIMDRQLLLKAVTYSQDSGGGSTATLEMVNRMGQEEAAQ
jgi:prophage tail gpP-like protein